MRVACRANITFAGPHCHAALSFPQAYVQWKCYLHKVTAHISQYDRSLIRNFLQIWTIKKQFRAVKEAVQEYFNSEGLRLDSTGPWCLKLKFVVLPVALASLYTLAFPIGISVLSFKKVVGVTTVRKQSPHVDRGGILQHWRVGKRECERRGKSWDLASASFHRKQSSFRCGPRASFKGKNLNRMFWMLQWRPTRAKVCHRPNREPVEWKDRTKQIQTSCRRVLMVKVTILYSASWLLLMNVADVDFCLFCLRFWFHLMIPVPKQFF